MTDERFGVKLDLDGAEKYQQAANRVRELEAQFNALQSQIASGATGWQQAQKNIQGVKASLDQARASADAAARSIKNAASAGGGAGGGGGKDGGNGKRGVAAGMAVLAAGQMADDAQYGFSAIINNIPILVGALAALAGVASGPAMIIAGVTAAIVALGNVAYNYIPVFGRLVDSVWGGLKAVTGGLLSMATGTDQTFDSPEVQRAKAVKAANDKKAAEAVSKFDAIDPEREKRSQAFLKAVGAAGGGAAVRKASGADGSLLDRAMGGDDAAIADVITQAAKNGNKTGARLAGAFVAAMDEGSDRKKIADWEEGRRWSEVLKENADDVDKLATIQAVLADAFERGEITADAYTRKMDQVANAMERAGDVAEREAQKAVDREMKRAADLAMIEVNKQQSRAESRVDFFANAYGGAFGNDAAGAIYRRAAGGQSFDDAQAAIKEQVEARLSAIRDPAMRSQAAAQIAEQARNLAERNAMGLAVGQDLRQQRLNAVGGALGVLMRHNAARFGNAGQVSGPEQKLETAADKFAAAVARLESGGLEARITAN
jgi:hypothetical protein